MKCRECVSKRRNHFIYTGVKFSSHHGLNRHVVINWNSPQFEEWPHLLKLSSELAKLSSGRIGKYIRCLGMGKQSRTPHIHYLLTEDGEAQLELRARAQLWMKHFFSSCVPDPEGLLSYFFDRNFIPTFDDRERPRGIRVLSASRGMPCGYPSVSKSPLNFGSLK